MNEPRPRRMPRGSTSKPDSSLTLPSGPEVRPSLARGPTLPKAARYVRANMRRKQARADVGWMRRRRFWLAVVRDGLVSVAKLLADRSTQGQAR